MEKISLNIMNLKVSYHYKMKVIWIIKLIIFMKNISRNLMRMKKMKDENNENFFSFNYSFTFQNTIIELFNYCFINLRRLFTKNILALFLLLEGDQFQEQGHIKY